MELLPDFGAVARTLADRVAARSRRRALLRSPFYRTFPYSAPVSIFEVDRRVFASTQLRILFNAVGKAGHSSVLLNIARAAHGRHLGVRDAKNRTFTRASSLDWRHVAQLHDYFKFTFVRDPFSRTLSAYLDKVVREKILPAPLIAETRGARPSFLEFCRYLERGGIYDDVHWAPQVSVMALPVESFDFLGRLERFDEDFRQICLRLGFNVGPFVRHDTHATESGQKLAHYYDDHSTEIVARIFAEDFRTLGYSTNR